MPNIKSAKKRAKQSEVHRARNVARTSALKTAVKKVLNALETNNDVTVAQDLLRDAQAKFSRAKSKGVVHRNTAARKIGRLAKKVAAQAQASK